MTKARTKKTTQVKRMTKKERFSELWTFVQLCYSMMDETDYKEIANRSGLSVSTLRRLAIGEFSLAVRFGTIQALGYAAGLQLIATDCGFKVALIKDR